MAIGDPNKNCPWVSSTEPSISLKETKLGMLVLCEVKYFSARFGCYRDIITMKIVMYENFIYLGLLPWKLFLNFKWLLRRFHFFQETYIPRLSVIDVNTILLSAKVYFTINLSDLFS